MCQPHFVLDAKDTDLGPCLTSVSDYISLGFSEPWVLTSQGSLKERKSL